MEAVIVISNICYYHYHHLTSLRQNAPITNAIMSTAWYKLTRFSVQSIQCFISR